MIVLQYICGMKLVFLSHPFFLGHQSMPRYLYMLADGMRKRGHHVEIMAPVERIAKLSNSKSLKKWFGYIDQYVIFKRELAVKVRDSPVDSLFVFTDHALGPWVPVVQARPHVIHCHDFIAQRSALDQIPNQTLGWTGKVYQRYIRNGYSKGRNFISVSEKTQRDLHEFLGRTPEFSEVVYNGLNSKLTNENSKEARAKVGKVAGVDVGDGYLLHVGGNQWYKNRIGVIDIYTEWRNTSQAALPLLFVGEKPDFATLHAKTNSPYASDIYFISDQDDKFIRSAYSGSTVFLFPSITEGFGWPIAEAMVCGSIVITTGETPMTEVGADAAMYVPKMPADIKARKAWAQGVAETISTIVNITAAERAAIVNRGYENVDRFKLDRALDKIESIYKKLAPSTHNSI